MALGRADRTAPTAIEVRGARVHNLKNVSEKPLEIGLFPALRQLVGPVFFPCGLRLDGGQALVFAAGKRLEQFFQGAMVR